MGLRKRTHLKGVTEQFDNGARDLMGVVDYIISGHEKVREREEILRYIYMHR